jgi:hypothetical protein
MMIPRRLALITLAGFAASALPALEIEQPAPETGHTIELQDLPALHLSINDNQLRAHFLNPENLVTAPPAESIVFIVDDPGHRNDEFRTVLRPAKDASLTSPRRLFPPYEFRIRLLIRLPGEETRILSNQKVDLAASNS